MCGRGDSPGRRERDLRDRERTGPGMRDRLSPSRDEGIGERGLGRDRRWIEDRGLGRPHDLPGHPSTDRHGERSGSPRGDMRGDGRGNIRQRDMEIRQRDMDIRQRDMDMMRQRDTDMRQRDIRGHARDMPRDIPRDVSGMSRGSDGVGGARDDGSTHGVGKRERDANDRERADKGGDRERGDWPSDKRPCVDVDVRKERDRDCDDGDASARAGGQRGADRDGDRNSDRADVGGHGGGHSEGGMQMGGAAPLPSKRMIRVPGHLTVDGGGHTEALTPSATPRALMSTSHFNNSVPPHAKTKSTRPPSPPGLPPEGADRFPVVWRGSVVSQVISTNFIST